ncbi:MAG: AMP-binding protein [bacterium]
MRGQIPAVLPELLQRAASQFPAHGVGHVQPDKSIQFQPYPQLLDRARRMLAGFQQKGILRGDKVILSLDNSGEIIPVIWACFLGGIIPALLQPPGSFTEYNPAAEKAEKVFRLLENPWVILSHKHMESWMKSGITQNHLIDSSTVSLDSDQPELPQLNTGDLALIQFSSGSTGDPKGVMLSHKNIITNIRDIITGIWLTENDISVSWLPLYHDMGLIGFQITPTLAGCQQYFIEPADFIKNPSLWLDNLSERQCNITGCPNFGQTIVNRYLNRKKDPTWDFSSIRVVFNGAEPISTFTMQEFISKLEEFGFDPVAMFPAYGLAEATLAVTFTPLEEQAEVLRFQRIPLLQEGIAVIADQEDENSMELVNLGRHLTHCTVKIIDETGAEVGEGIVGSVQASGENVSAGYYRNDEATGQTFIDGWLHTGDLGFLYKGDLFIMGRLKDVIFINGINYYAHDLEIVTHNIEGVTSGKIVIAGYFDEREGRDKLLIFLVGSDNELTRTTFVKIKSHLKQGLGLQVDTFIPIRSNDIPRTSSGKIQRYKMVNRFLRGEFTVVKL